MAVETITPVRKSIERTAWRVCMMTFRRSVVALTAAMMFVVVSGARAELMTADRAVQIALQHSPDAANAHANVLDAKSGVYGAYSGVLPHISASVARNNSVTRNSNTPVTVGGLVSQTNIIQDFESHGTTPGITGSWNVLNFSNLSGLSSAKRTLEEAQHRQASSRNDIAFNTRQQFYAVVKAIRLADVATGALKLARDNERRVRALFEVGSVSKSDVLKAEVSTAQGVLDSLTASETITIQRIALATQIGIAEPEVGQIDTMLTTTPQAFDETALVTEAASHRRDIMAAQAEVLAANASKTSARLMRFPYLTASGAYDFSTTSSRTQTTHAPGLPPSAPPGVFGSRNNTDSFGQLQLAVNWDLIDGLTADSRNATATARQERAVTALDALKRNLASEVHQALISYNEALSRSVVARSAFASALENVKLTQEKYNVGSATILDLIDAQVQLQRAGSDAVSAMADTHVAEAQIDRVRGKQE
jgi:outer membrane protein